MTSITITSGKKLKKTSFSDVKDLFSYIIDNNLVTEIWTVNKNDLSDNSKTLLKKSKSKKQKNLVNI